MYFRKSYKQKLVRNTRNGRSALFKEGNGLEYISFPSFFAFLQDLKKNAIKSLTSGEHRLRQLYRKHNLYVQHVVPKENLLVWNLKDGWEPLCKFLDKPIPKGTFSLVHSSGRRLVGNSALSEEP